MDNEHNESNLNHAQQPNPGLNQILPAEPAGLELNGNLPLTVKEYGKLGGRIAKKMLEAAEQALIEQIVAEVHTQFQKELLGTGKQE